MLKRILALFCALVMLPLFPAILEEEPSPTLRALLVGSDTFLTKESTHPIAENNVKRIRETLEKDVRGYEHIQSYYDEIGNIAALERAAAHAFSGATENDISLLYFSTHGLYTQDHEAFLYLCDTMEENLLSPEELFSITSAIPGKKVIVLDACNSGAFIAKGLDDLSATHPFVSDDHYIITSSGGSEASWQWQGQDEFTSGSSYFADVFCSALSGHYPADQNRDGIITMDELFSYLMTNYAASTPHTYPEKSSFPLFCHKNDGQYDSISTLTDINFADTLLTAGRSEITFSFTVRRETILYYRITYYRSGAWDFENAQHFLDDETGTGTVSPGRKERRLLLDMPNGEDYGYAMVQFITMEEGLPVFQGGRLLCIQPRRSQVMLSVDTPEAFSLEPGRELPILIGHNVPCGLSVTVKNAFGKAVKRLTYDQPTRPQQLSTPGSAFYWDGTDLHNEPVPAGTYYVQAETWIGDEKFTAYGIPISVTVPSKEAP